MSTADPAADRLDWFLLLPAGLALPVADVMVLGGTEDMADALIRRSIATHWRRPADSRDQAALVVAWPDASSSWTEVVGHVAPGGVLVAAIERRGLRRRPASIGSLQRAVGRRRGRVMSAHLVQPSFDRSTRYLPIDHPGAMRWYLRTLFVAGSPRMRAVRGVLSVLARRRGAPLLAAASPRALVVATMGVADTPRGSPDGSPGDRLIVLTSGYDAASRAVAIPFASGAAVPMIVVKVATGAHAAEATLGEHRRLGELHTLLPADLAAALPRPTGTTSIAGRAACIQTCAPGPSMSATTGAWARTIASKQIDLDVVVDWLTAFATATRLNTEGGWADWVDVFAEARRTLTPPADVDVLLATADGLARSTGLATAAVQQHFDPGPWNVHVDGRRPFLIDWEVDGTRRTRSSGPHLADVLYLATYWYFQVMRIDGPDEETAAVARLFAEPAVHDRGVAAVRAAIDRSLAAADLDRSCVPAVLGAMWAERALYTHRRRSSFGTPLAPGASRPEAFLAVLATHSADLCGPHGWWALPAGSDVDVPVASTASSPAGCAGAGPRRADAG